MRWLLLLVLFLLVAGCNRSFLSGQQPVVLINASHEGVSSVNNQTKDRISFVMQNDKDYEADCDIIITMANGTNESVRRSNVGVLGPKERKKVTLSMSMFEGESGLKIVPDCKKP
ncbi:MAG: hypothetical protein KKD17_01335 [Nanoarchaeota archaeon]|nr:hypothetical protein [Nanoarchaeota archaeon]